ncbi:MAG: DedA family protein [Anaerolineae bacterium]|nr:DedA family protein [Anaerolineae bacterium]
MMELNLTDLFLSWLADYGSVALGLILLLGALGVPVPATLTVVTTGALVQQGSIEGGSAAAFGLAGAVLGDSLSYMTGRLAKRWVQHRFGKSSFWQTAQYQFEQRGAWAVYLTRFLLTPLALPINLIAGSSGYSFRSFLTYDLAGEITWLAIYGGSGYFFGSQWDLLNQWLSDYSGWLGGLIIAGISIYFLGQHKLKTVHSGKWSGLALTQYP